MSSSLDLLDMAIKVYLMGHVIVQIHWVMFFPTVDPTDVISV